MTTDEQKDAQFTVRGVKTRHVFLRGVSVKVAINFVGLSAARLVESIEVGEQCNTGAFVVERTM